MEFHRWRKDRDVTPEALQENLPSLDPEYLINIPRNYLLFFYAASANLTTGPHVNHCCGPTLHRQVW
jgi:hypothetical protein